jgi:pimeloyl-ACP methyl ester carboxylesterase
MQLAYQFPERCERLVLIDSGGLGSEVNLLLRAATLPGAELVLPLLASERVLGVGRGVGRLFGRLGLRVHTDVEEMAKGHASLAEHDARAAFVHTLRTIVDPTGQRVNANDRLYLAEEVPFLIIWGGRDKIIPVAHAHTAHARVPSSRLEIFEKAGHFPQIDEPMRFIEVLTDFIDTTDPAEVEPERWREMLQKGEPVGRA